jgi:hypothetical protein
MDGWRKRPNGKKFSQNKDGSMPRLRSACGHKASRRSHDNFNDALQAVWKHKRLTCIINFLPLVQLDFETKMKLAQTILSKLRRSDLFVENRPAQDSQLRRSGIFRRRADVAPTELEIFLDALATNIPRLRRWEMAWAQN